MPVRSPVGMIMFPHLFVPRARAPNADPVFNLILLFDEAGQKDPAYAAMKQAVALAIDEEWGAGKSRDANWLRQTKFRSPFRDAIEKDKYNGFTPGKTFINPWTKTKPGIVNAQREVIYVPGDVFAGQLGRVTVSPYCYSVSGNTGCSLMLDNIQVVKLDMPRMDGRQSAEQAFDPWVEDATEVATADDLPF
jgi:Enterobacter phage Enc34, ssDNA-binding protein